MYCSEGTCDVVHVDIIIYSFVINYAIYQCCYILKVHLHVDKLHRDLWTYNYYTVDNKDIDTLDNSS